MSLKDDVLAYIKNSGHPVQRGEVCEKFALPPATAARLLDDLSRSGQVDRIGSGRSTAYAPDSVDAYLNSPDRQACLRDVNGQRIPYDFDRIRNFTPDVSSFFTPEQLDALTAAGALPGGITHDDYLTSIHRKMLLETSWASSVLEGNTYSLLDTEELFENGTPASGVDIASTQMLLNHKHAIEYILGNIRELEISRRDILNIHALLSDGLMKDPGDTGRIRYRSIGIGSSIYSPLDVPTHIEEELDALLSIARQIDNPFNQSMYLLANIAYLQPFTDVNKRTSRLMANIPLLQAGVMPMSFFQMPESSYKKGVLHYYETGDFRRLAKEYVSGYVISASRFREIVENRPSPEQIRMKMLLRKEVAAAVFDIVRNGADIAAVMPEKPLSENERDFFIAYVESAVRGLNEGNALLFGLTPDDVKRPRGARRMR